MNDFNPSPEFEEKVRKAVDVPSAKPEFVNKLRNELARRPVKMKPRFILKPVWAFAFVIVALTLIASAPAAVNALKKIFGYVPGVGLVENSSGLRMLAEPASLTRDGVTLTITNVFVYQDRVELIYSVQGIASENDGTQAEDGISNPTAFCGGVNPGEFMITDGDARLRLPDGTILERDYTGKYPQNIFAMQPVYEAAIPADVTEMTFVLKCIPWARLGATPENWELPFSLVTVPAGTIVGEPVIEVTQPVDEEPASSSTAEPVSSPKVTMILERIVPTDSNTVLYVHFNMENADPSLISIMPQSAYVIDSLGQKIPLRGGFIWQPFEHKVGNAFEFVTESKPADGPLTIIVDQAIAYYMPLYTDPPQATSEELSFTFDAGENPQHGQVWNLNKIFTIAGYEFEITSAQAVTFSDIETPSFIDGSQGYDYGYQFAVESDPSLGLSVEMDIHADKCWLSDVKTISPSPLLYTQLCRDEYPKGLVTVTVREMSVTLEDDLQVEWIP
ncbi:hypothetical protein [Candidatus Villigracilis affinis]|uniref:hypothetical protein n=1 Tax=Candidatus Villigracilis affinis TaxID=3140682 RepID=UPI002A196F93|nr:DUF4179 domain-containing protein [Anaerolineales bacterium]